MRKSLLLLAAIVVSVTAFSQDQTNKGKDFWIPYPEHIDGSSSAMGLYITSDVACTGTITVGATNLAFTVVPNTVVYKFLGPNASGSAANTGVYLGGYLDNVITGRSIHITSTKPVVVFAHIIKSARSGATLVLPVPVWGIDYVVPSYANYGASASFGILDVYASKPNTTIEINPSANTRNGLHTPGVAFQVTLPNVGDIYQLEFSQNADMSGTTVKSLASGGSGCNPIGVFSSTTWSGINCGGASGGDNFYQQLFPSSSWGKEFLTGPLKRVATSLTDKNNDLIRVFVKDPATVVTKTDNGVTTTLTGLSPAGYYEYATPNPTFIQADQPIQVMQYITSETCGNPATQSDPEMIALSSVEQTINDITVFSAHQNYVPPGQSQVTKHYINVIMKTNNTSLFRINGAVPTAVFTPIPSTNYSYLKEDVTSRAASNPVFHLSADSGFSAIAYGFGDVESYGYNAGTNVKDLYQQIGVSTQYGVETSPSVCTGTPFRFKVSLPYCVDSIAWDLTNLPFPPIPPPTYPPTQIYTSCTVTNDPANPGPDSITVVNGKQIYWYSLPTQYSFGTIGSFPVTLTTYFSGTSLCGNTQQIDFDLNISDPPIADFSSSGSGCVAEPVQFNETTPQIPKPTYHWWWDFGDPTSGPANNTASIKNPVHLFSGPGTYHVRFSDITTPGCLSDTVFHDIVINPLPTGTISGTTTVCINTPGQTVTFTGSGGTSPYTYTYTIDAGSGPGAPINTNSTVVPVPTNVAGTFIYTFTNIADVGSTLCSQAITGQQATITVTPDATINLTSGVGTPNQTICVNTLITPITYSIGGSGTNATVTGLPAGVTGIYNSGVLTISGTPSVSGTFLFNVSTTGPCITPSANGSLIVNADATLTLTSAAATTSQTVCVNTFITPITYQVGGSATNATVTGLPPGVGYVYSGGIVTITGAPTVSSGPLMYTVATVGPCINPTLTGTIAVNSNATISLTSAAATANQTVCINNPITTITYAIGGSGTNATITGLPTGVNGNYSGGVVTINGSPTVAGLFTYTVTPVGPCVNPPLTGTINVNNNSTLALTSAPATTSQTVCINTLINPITYAVGGGATNATVTGLPAGVGYTYSGGIITISGNPSVSGGPFTYTVQTVGPCINPTMTGTITVTADATITLTSGPGSDNQSLCINTAIMPITYAIGGSGTNATVTGLPAGVSGNYAAGVFTINGTPSVSGTFNYTVSPVGPCINPPLTGRITVNANSTLTLTSAVATTTQTVCINTPITPITYAVAGGATGAFVILLPTGVGYTYSAGTLTITGSPSVSGGPLTYTVSTSGPCINPTMTGTITVTANATIALTSAAATANQTVCVNNAITPITYSIGGSGTGATITGLPTGVNGGYAGGVVTILGTPTVSGGPFTYTVTPTGPCVNPPLTGTITVNPNASVALTSAPPTASQAVCKNTAILPITYIIAGSATGATVTGLPPGVSYVYSGGLLTITGTPTVANATAYTYTVATVGPCAPVTVTGTIMVNELPTANFNVSAPTCQSKYITFTDASTPNSGVVNNWQWDFGDLSTGTGTPIVHGYAATGPYTVTLTVTTDKGCVSNPIASKVVTVNVNPKAGFMVPEVCINDIAAVFTDTSSIAAGTLTNWHWDFGDPGSGAQNTSTTKDGTHLYTATGSYTVQHIAYSSTGCSDTVYHTIFINGANPVSNFAVSNAGALCANDSVAITNQSLVVPGSVTKLEIVWDNVGAPGVVFTDNDPVFGGVYKHLYPNFQAPLTKNYTIRVRAYSGTLCFNDLTRVITINAAPKTQFSPIPDACLLSPPYQITQASEVGGVPGSGTFSGAGISPTGLFNPAVAGAGVHTIKYTYTSSAAGCIDTISQTVNVIDTASALFSYNSPVCEHTDVTFTDLSTAPAGVVLSNTTWDFGDGSPTEGHAPGSVFTHIFPAAAVYNVKMYNTSAYGCRSAVNSIPVTISPLPRPSFTMDKPSYCLPAAAVKFNNASTISDGTAMTYLWNFGDPSSGLSNTSVAVTGNHAFATMGPFSVKLTATSMVGCQHDTTIILNTIHPQPKADFTFSKPTICIHDQITFKDNSDGMDGTVTAWNWDLGDGTKSVVNPITYTYGDTLTYNVSLYVVNSLGCNSDTLVKPFVVNSYPTVDAGPDRSVLEGGRIVLQPIVTGNGLHYLWTPNTYLVSDSVMNAIVTLPRDDVKYTLTVTGRGGCSASDFMQLTVLKFPTIPNTFTPNNDGINDVWSIDHLETYPDNHVRVFTRTGEAVFESHGYTKPWDGTKNGKPLPFDTYYYIIEPGNGRTPITGYVTIIK